MTRSVRHASSFTTWAALTCILLGTCGQSSRGERGDPLAAEPVAIRAAAPALPPRAATLVPVLDDHGIFGLTTSQMASAEALAAAFPAATVATETRRYCLAGSTPTSVTTCASGARAAAAPKAYQVITLRGTGTLGRGEYVLEVVTDLGQPVDITLELARLEPSELVGLPATLADTQHWRTGAHCTFEQYPRPAAHVSCRYPGATLRFVVDGPTWTARDHGGGSWDLAPADLAGWLADHGGNRVAAVAWGEGLGAQVDRD